MKYISLQNVVNAYINFQNSMTNKSWGYLALLKECTSFIRPTQAYKIYLDNVSNYLENIFNFNVDKKQYNSGKSMYVVFSNKWKDFFNAQGYNTPNVYDVAIWALRRNSFNDTVTSHDVLLIFANTFNIPLDMLNICFDTIQKEIVFEDNLYSENELKSILSRKSIDVSRNNIDSQKKSVVANPGEISRGPFIQPLYAGLDIADYVLILQSDFTSLYGKVSDNQNTSVCVEYKTTSSILPLLTALRTKPFLLLAGISGTGKSRIVRELAFKSCPSYLRDKDGTTPGNYCMIEVKPNWHDSSELLGYYSNISKKFIFTKFVKFLVRATMHPTVPFFVCLDEMNLAPVEQYFAEFLSVLETRKLVKTDEGSECVVSGNLVRPESFVKIVEKEIGGVKMESKITPTDKDWFYEFFEKESINVEEQKIVEEHTDQTFVEKGLSLPENVFVIGTVNMDDTTHQFSRKVIDRAMTIEMNGGKLEDMFGGSSDLEYPTEPDDKILSMATLKSRYVSADDVLDKCERIKSDEEALKFVVGKDADGAILTDEDTLPKRLNAINKILENTPFQISYRVFNELVIYLAVLCDDESNKDKSIDELANAALDQITLMKILPRIEGDYDMFNTNGAKNKLEQLQGLFAEDSSSWKKLDEMIKRLNTTEFTRFWP